MQTNQKTHTLDKQFNKHCTIISYLTDTNRIITDVSLEKLNPFHAITMILLTNSPVPGHTLPQIIFQLNQLTEDRSEDDVELRGVERRRRRNEEIIKNTQKPNENPRRNQTNIILIQSELRSAKKILGTIEIINGQSDIGIEDFIQSVKEAKVQCLQAGLLLDFIIAQKITLLETNAIRFLR